MGKDTRIKNVSSGRAGQYVVEVVNGDGSFSALEQETSSKSSSTMATTASRPVI